MLQTGHLSLLAGLINRDGRASAAQDLARRLGADHLIVFIRDPEVGAHLPAPGFPQTLSQGRLWRAFIRQCSASGTHAGHLPEPRSKALAPAAGLAADDGSVLILLGGELDSSQLSEAAEDLRLFMPFLAAVFRAEQAVVRHAGEAAAASQAAAKAQALANALDAARGVAESAQRQLQSLARASVLIHGKRSQAEVLQTVTEQARHIIGAHQAYTTLAAADGSAGSVRAVSLSDKWADWRERDAGPAGFGVYGRIFDLRQAVRVTQAELEAHPAWPEVRAEAGHRPPLRGWLAAPLTGPGGRVLGLLELSDKAAGDFTEHDEAILAQLAQLGALALEKAAANEALRDSEERYRLLVEGATGLAFVMMDPEGRVASWNAGAERIFGYTDAEILGRHFSVFFLPEDRAAGRPDDELTQARSGKEGPDDHWLVRKDGSRFWASGATTALWDTRGTLKGFSKVIRDMTERKRAEDQIQKLNAELEQKVMERTQELTASNKELEAFCYSVSHDLRSPLRSIAGFSEMILDDYHDRLDPEAQEHFRRIQAASHRMAQLIDNLLDLSRLTRKQMRQESVDLSAQARAIADDLARMEPGRSVEFSIAPGLTAVGDPELLRSVLQNLLDNAWKFTGKRPAARIEFGGSPRNNDFAYFVRDNGVGFDMSYVSKLFGVFSRLHASHEFPGTGIGLATVQRIVERHGGQVWAEAEPDRGATFYFTLGGGPRPPETESASAAPGWTAS